MGKLNLAKICQSIKTSFGKHSPEILTGIGIAGSVVAIVCAVKATPKAMVLIEEKKKELQKEKLTTAETIKAAWPCYIPALAAEAASIVCLLGSSRTNNRRSAALATAYSLSESAFREYKSKVIETIGEKKEKDVTDSVSKSKVENTPVQEVIITEKGNTLCLDFLSGRYFKTDIEKLKKAINDLNFRMRSESFISLNDLYYEIGLEGTGIGEDIGWDIDRGYIEPRFSSQLTSDGSPCLVLDFQRLPEYRYI